MGHKPYKNASKVRPNLPLTFGFADFSVIDIFVLHFCCCCCTVLSCLQLCCVVLRSGCANKWHGKHNSEAQTNSKSSWFDHRHECRLLLATLIAHAQDDSTYAISCRWNKVETSKSKSHESMNTWSNAKYLLWMNLCTLRPKKGDYSCDNIYDSSEYLQHNAKKKRRRKNKKKEEKKNHHNSSTLRELSGTRRCQLTKHWTDEENPVLKLNEGAVGCYCVLSNQFCCCWCCCMSFLVSCQFLSFDFLLLAFHIRTVCVQMRTKNISPSQMTYVNNKSIVS